MVVKEDAIVKLKSELLVLRAKIDEAQKHFESRVAEENAKYQKDFQAGYSSQEKRVRDEKDQLLREKNDLEQKIHQKENELKSMAEQYSGFREDTKRNDAEMKRNIHELQQKLLESGQLNQSQTKQLQERIESFNNEN